MQEVLKFIIGIVILVLGIPIGSFLAKKTKEELKSGQFWFILIIIIALILAIISLILKEDALLFSMLFVAIVTSRSLKRR